MLRRLQLKEDLIIALTFEGLSFAAFCDSSNWSTAMGSLLNGSTRQSVNRNQVVLLLALPYRPSRIESECSDGFFEFKDSKSCSFQTLSKSIRVEGYKRVSHVKHSHKEALQGIAADGNSAGFENSPHLAK